MDFGSEWNTTRRSTLKEDHPEKTNKETRHSQFKRDHLERITYQQIPKAYTKHMKLTIQHAPLITLSIVLDTAKLRKLPPEKNKCKTIVTRQDRESRDIEFLEKKTAKLAFKLNWQNDGYYSCKY